MAHVLLSEFSSTEVMITPEGKAKLLYREVSNKNMMPAHS